MSEPTLQFEQKGFVVYQFDTASLGLQQDVHAIRFVSPVQKFVLHLGCTTLHTRDSRNIDTLRNAEVRPIADFRRVSP